jgi:hypothetical protein
MTAILRFLKQVLLYSQYEPDVDSAFNRIEYQESSWG